MPTPNFARAELFTGWPKPYWSAPGIMLYCGDVRERLRALPAGSVQSVVTSPPYWGLRSYSNCPCATWISAYDSPTSSLEGGGNIKTKDPDPKCDKCGGTGKVPNMDTEIGNEPSPDCGSWGQAQCGACFVCSMVSVFRELYRVLRDDGTAWLNLGDTYATGSASGVQGPNSILPTKSGSKNFQLSAGGMNRNRTLGLRNGNMIGVPWRVAFALQADGWILCSDLPWVKRSCMPESQTKRPCKSLEYVFMLSKNEKCYFDMDAVRQPSPGGRSTGGSCYGKVLNPQGAEAAGSSQRRFDGKSEYSDRGFRNTDLWFQSVDKPHGMVGVDDEIVGLDVTTRGYGGGHFACVDDQTEALTKNGWKIHSELTDGDVIAAYCQHTDKLRWEPATFHRYDYDGEMVVYDKRDTSQWLTPNHRCLVQTRDGTVNVKEASELSMRDCFLMTAEFEEESGIGIGEDMASIIGWFASDGHIKFDPSGIASKHMACISQSVTSNSDKVDSIRTILNRMKADYLYNESTSDRYNGMEITMAEFSIGGMIGWRLVNEFCTGDKEISDALTCLPKNELQCLLDAFVSGDGHTRKDDGRTQIIQKNKHNCEQLQIIAIKLGYRALLTQRDDGCYVLYMTRGKWLNVCGTGRSNSMQIMYYNGTVWCPNVDSGFWLARRNGKPFITGNTFPPALVRPLILASTSEHGCCAMCNVPWKRVVVRRNATSNEGDSGVKRDRSFGWSRNGVDSTLDSGIAKRDTVGWQQQCGCVNAGVVPCIVLDPFAGSGTTVATAIMLGRAGVGIDLSELYLNDDAIPRIQKAMIGQDVGKRNTTVIRQGSPPPRRPL